MTGSPPLGGDALVAFRSALYATFSAWRDALFELTDAVLCAASPVTSVPSLSLEPEFTRSHGSLYKALAKGRIDEERLRRLLVANRPADWPMVFAVQALGWPADRGGVALPVDLPALVGVGLLDRPA